MTDQELLDRGYKKYDSYITNVECLFQKRFDDDVGKKYYIDVNKWNWTKYPQIDKDVEYEYDVQLYKGENRDAINLTFLSSWDLDRVEEFVEWLWNQGFEYYERFY